MSIEASELARKINNLDLSLEKSNNRKDWEKGKNDYESILLSIRFILPRGLKLVVDYLNDNGKVVYEKFFKELIEEEIQKGEKKK